MKTFALCMGLVLWASVSFAQTVDRATISWLPNSEPDIAGYRLYQSTASGVYGTAPAYLVTPAVHTITVVLPQQRCTVRYYWVVTAFNTMGQASVRSAQVFKDIIGAQYWIGACRK